MVEFDSLPQNSRLLILATLELEVASENCKSIYDLARKRHQTAHDVWRDVCKKTSLPRCTMPPRVTGNDFAAGAAKNVFVFADKPANASVFGDAPAPAGAPAQSKVAGSTTTAAPGATTTVAPATHARPAAGGRRAPNRNIALAAGIAAILLWGIGLAVFAIPRSTEGPHASSPTTVTRPNEAARAKPTFDASSMPVPEGTARRLDAINKSFSKQ
jgi:hypothetical protein